MWNYCFVFFKCVFFFFCTLLGCIQWLNNDFRISLRTPSWQINASFSPCHYTDWKTDTCWFFKIKFYKRWSAKLLRFSSSWHFSGFCSKTQLVSSLNVQRPLVLECERLHCGFKLLSKLHPGRARARTHTQFQAVWLSWTQTHLRSASCDHVTERKNSRLLL